MNISILQQRGMWKSRAFVIAGDDEDRNSQIGDTLERLVSAVRDARVRRGSVEDVAAVYDEIDVAGERGSKRCRIIQEKVESASPASDARSNREVEAEVRVGEKEDSDRSRHTNMVYMPVFVR
jgi:hypothetical protein